MKKRIKYKQWLILLVVVTALSAGSGWFVLSKGDSHFIYRMDKISRGNISEVVTANGILSPIQVVTVGAQVSGQVKKVYVKVNDKVKKGQLLAEIDPSLLLSQVKQDQSAMEIARITYEQAQRDLERERVLLAKDYVAKVDLEHAQQTYLQAKNSYDSAKTVLERDAVNVEYAKVQSPIDGVIISQDVGFGETLQSSFQSPSMFKVATELSQMQITVSVSEADIPKIKMDMPVKFTVNAFNGREFTGKVQLINLNPNNQPGAPITYNVVVGVENKDFALLPGMSAYVTITLLEKNNILRAPPTALLFTPVQQPASGNANMRVPYTGRDGDPGTVYILKHNVPTPVSVTTGIADDNYVEISGEDITEGQDVITGTLYTGSIGKF